MVINGDDDAVRGDDAGRLVGRFQFPAQKNHPFYLLDFYESNQQQTANSKHTAKTTSKASCWHKFLRLHTSPVILLFNPVFLGLQSRFGGKPPKI